MNTVKKIIAASALITAGMVASVSASAGEATSNLESWQAKAAIAVDKTMVYSKFAQKYNDEGTVTFKVTVDSDGDFVDAKLLKNTGRGFIRSSAIRTIKNADFPALPSSADQGNMTFKVQLSYLIDPTPAELKALKIQSNGRVSSEKLASAKIILDAPRSGR